MNREKLAPSVRSATDEVVVENNALSVPQIESFAEKARGCEARGDCGQIVKEMEDLSLNQQKEMIAVCSTNPKACKDKYGDIPANGMLVRKALDSLFDADVPSEMKNDISSFWARKVSLPVPSSRASWKAGMAWINSSLKSWQWQYWVP